MHGPGTLLRRVPGYRKVTVPLARAGSANGLRERISDETEPSARAALASGLRESISEEIVPEARHSRVTRYATQERAGDRGHPYTNQRAGGTLLLHVQMFSLCRSNPNYRKHRSLQVAHVIHPHIRGQDDVLVVA